MQSTHMAPLTFQSEDIMKVLLIDDEEKDSIEKQLLRLGCDVDAVESPKEAAGLLQEGKYQLSIIDIRFNAPNISGDEFARKNIDLLAGGKVVAYTGFRDHISKDNKKLFDRIIDKGSRGDPLADFVKTVYDERKMTVEEQIKRREIDNIRLYLDPDWKRSQQMLIDELSTAQNKDEKIIWYKGKDMTAGELIEEVNDQDSEVGQSHIRMMMRWLQKKRKR